MAITLAIIKYGEENFVIEKIDEAYNIDELNEKEIFYIKKYKSKCPNGYNIGNGGLNRNHSIETRRKIGESNKGKVGYYKGLKLSDEHRKNLSISHTGHNMKEETKIKLSTINKLKKIDPKVRDAASIKNSKIYLLEKDNSLYVITNMKKFAMRNGHDKSNLSEFASGKKRDYIVHDENNVKGFFGDYRFLSNFHMAPVWYESILYPSTEHAYQAAKTLDESVRMEFLGLPCGALS